MPRDYRDICGGMLLTGFGLLFSWYAITHYNLGTVRQMGPGMFPAALGVLLAVCGLALIVAAFFRPGEKSEIRLREPFFVIGSLAAFALVIRPFGLIPAILSVTIISSLAERKLQPVALAILCVALCLIAWLTFSIGLRLPLNMFRWPF